MPRKKSVDHDLRLIVPKNATLKQIYAIARKQFSAADLQKFTDFEHDEVLDTEKLLEELEQVQNQTLAKRKGKR